jgi:hypothetical protein
MLITLDWKGLESSLPNVAAARVMVVIPSHMARQKPLHPTAEIAVSRRPEDKVEMIGHETIREDPHRHPATGFAHQVHEGGIITVAMKYGSARVSTIENVVADVGGGGANRAGHTGSVRKYTPLASEKEKRGHSAFLGKSRMSPFCREA